MTVHTDLHKYEGVDCAAPTSSTTTLPATLANKDIWNALQNWMWFIQFSVFL